MKYFVVYNKAALVIICAAKDLEKTKLLLGMYV